MVNSFIFATIMETKYRKIPPAEMFAVTVEREVKHDTPLKMHYEFSFRVEAKHSENDFINLFAALVVAHGRHRAEAYAAMMGVDHLQLTTTLTTLSGAGIQEWTDVFMGMVAEALLRETDWQVARIAKEARFTSAGV
ncbi:MAG: hypothetical protein LBV32_00135, partial [Tannerellaceae bacterium]|nr:hypothetical protein [Tannerellaceae bacterium]